MVELRNKGKKVEFVVDTESDDEHHCLDECGGTTCTLDNCCQDDVDDDSDYSIQNVDDVLYEILEVVQKILANQNKKPFVPILPPPPLEPSFVGDSD